MSDLNKENLENFKGIYYNDQNVQQYFEGGAHFSFVELCRRLERIVLTISPARRGKSMYEEAENNLLKDTLPRNVETNSVERTKPESRKVASDNSKCTISAPKSVSKDFVSPCSIKSEQSLKREGVKIIDPQDCLLQNYDKMMKRIHVSQNKTSTNTRTTQNAGSVALSNNDLKNCFKKIMPKIIPHNNIKAGDIISRVFPQQQSSNLGRNNVTVNRTLLQDLNDKTVHQEKLFKKIQQKTIHQQNTSNHNMSSFSKPHPLKPFSASRKASPFVQKSINESNIMQKSFFKEKTSNNQKLLSKNSSMPAEISNVLETTNLLKSQNIERSLLINNKSRNVGRQQNKLDPQRSSFIEKNSLKVHTVDNNNHMLSIKIKEQFVSKNADKNQPQSLEKNLLLKKPIGTASYNIKNPNKLVKIVNNGVKRRNIASDNVGSKDTLIQGNVVNKSIHIKPELYVKVTKQSVELSNGVKPQYIHTKNLSQQSNITNSRLNISSINEKRFNLVRLKEDKLNVPSGPALKLPSKAKKF